MLTENEQREILVSVYEALKEKGYNPIGQLTGFILTEDPTYITNHKGARHLVRNINRDFLIKCLLRDFLEDLEAEAC